MRYSETVLITTLSSLGEGVKKGNLKRTWKKKAWLEKTPKREEG